jgi:hypothetical protein
MNACTTDNTPGTDEQIKTELENHEKECGCRLNRNQYYDLRQVGFQPQEIVILGCQFFKDR